MTEENVPHVSSSRGTARKQFVLGAVAQKVVNGFVTRLGFPGLQTAGSESTEIRVSRAAPQDDAQRRIEGKLGSVLGLEVMEAFVAQPSWVDSETILEHQYETWNRSLERFWDDTWHSEPSEIEAAAYSAFANVFVM